MKISKREYQNTHYWVRKNMGIAYYCTLNPEHETPTYFHWANMSQEYKKEKNDWRSLCPSCHSKYDNDKMSKEDIEKLRNTPTIEKPVKRLTLYLSEDLLRFAKILAATKGTSLSQLVEIYLEQQQSDYDAIKKLKEDYDQTTKK